MKLSCSMICLLLVASTFGWGQADFFGTQYLYRAGYDPQALVSFLEKIENLEKFKPGLIARAFESHPPTPDRIAATQREIATLLPARNEYLETTFEFDDVKTRLACIENKRKLIVAFRSSSVPAGHVSYCPGSDTSIPHATSFSGKIRGSPCELPLISYKSLLRSVKSGSQALRSGRAV